MHACVCVRVRVCVCVRACTCVVMCVSVFAGSQGPDLCSLCDNVVDVKFSPCGHAVMCNQCAPKAKRCPVCKVSLR